MDPERFDSLFINPGQTIRETITAIDAGAAEVALVVDEDRRLQGTVTDGDVRRALLRGKSLDEPVDEIVHENPVTAPLGIDPDELLELMTSRRLEQIPLIKDGRVADLAVLRQLVDPHEHGGDQVLVMAGGKGERLRPLTDETPKPMLPVAGKPLLETIVEQVRHAGLSKVVMSVNYQAEKIEEHFGNGKDFGVEISYLQEEQPLGTAGALQMLRSEIDKPLLVINADLLTRVNFGALLRFHSAEGNALTVGVRRYSLEVPYGVVDIDDTRVVGLEEKPSVEFFVNAGIYAIGPEVVDLVPAEPTMLTMTDLVSDALKAGLQVGSFPIHEYWLDIGHLADYERAEAEHGTHFTKSND